MANFPQLIAPTGMNQYVGSFQKGMATGAADLAKQQYAQKFKEITGVDATGNEKLDAAIYQKTEQQKQQEQFIANKPEGARIGALQSVGSYLYPDIVSPYKAMTIDLSKKKYEEGVQSKKEQNLKESFEYSNNRVLGWAKDQVALLNQLSANPDVIAAKTTEINKIKDEALNNIDNAYKKGLSGTASYENTVATFPYFIPTTAVIDAPTTTAPVSGGGGVVTGGTGNKPQYEIGKTYAFKDKSGNTIHKTYTKQGWQ